MSKLGGWRETDTYLPFPSSFPVFNFRKFSTPISSKRPPAVGISMHNLPKEVTMETLKGHTIHIPDSVKFFLDIVLFVTVLDELSHSVDSVVFTVLKALTVM